MKQIIVVEDATPLIKAQTLKTFLTLFNNTPPSLPVLLTGGRL